MSPDAVALSAAQEWSLPQLLMVRAGGYYGAAVTTTAPWVPLLGLSADERARLIATADLLLSELKTARQAEVLSDDSGVVPRWIARVAAVKENLDAVTDWHAAEAYAVGGIETAKALRRLFPGGLPDRDFDAEVQELLPEIELGLRELAERAGAQPPMTADDALEDLLGGHAGARFKYVDVRSDEAWRHERLPYDRHVPLNRLRDEIPHLFSKDAELVVYGSDQASSDEAAMRLADLGYQHVLTVPGGFEWFKRRGWRLERGPDHEDFN
jgi:rhodanese-related sulfurtransferase